MINPRIWCSKYWITCLCGVYALSTIDALTVPEELHRDDFTQGCLDKRQVIKEYEFDSTEIQDGPYVIPSVGSKTMRLEVIDSLYLVICLRQWKGNLVGRQPLHFIFYFCLYDFIKASTCQWHPLWSFTMTYKLSDGS